MALTPEQLYDLVLNIFEYRRHLSNKTGVFFFYIIDMQGISLCILAERMQVCDWQ